MAMSFSDYNFPKDRKYRINNTPNHFWISESNDGLITLGLSDFFQKQIGNINSVTIKDSVGVTIKTGKTLGLVKAKNYSAILKYPLSGSIVKVNTVSKNPKLINDSPYDDGWLIVLKPDPKLNDQNDDKWVDLTNADSEKAFKDFIEKEITNKALMADECCPDLLGGSGVVRRLKK